MTLKVSNIQNFETLPEEQ